MRAAAEDAHGQSSADNLAQRDQISINAIKLQRAAQRHAEAVITSSAITTAFALVIARRPAR